MRRNYSGCQVHGSQFKVNRFDIANVSAPCGATYPVFCFFEYDLKETHYTAVSKALIRIAEKENRFWRMRWVLLSAGILFGAIFALYRLKRK